MKSILQKLLLGLVFLSSHVIFGNQYAYVTDLSDKIVTLIDVSDNSFLQPFMGTAQTPPAYYSGIVVLPGGTTSFSTTVQGWKFPKTTLPSTVDDALEGVCDYSSSIAVTPDGSTLFIAGSYNGLFKIPSNTMNPFGSKQKYNSIPSADAVTISSDGMYAYALNTTDQKIYRAVTSSTSSEELILTGPPLGAGPLDIAISRDNSKIYVTSGSGQVVNIIDIKNNFLNTQISYMGVPFNKIALTTDNSKAYITTTNSEFNLFELNTTTNVLTPIPLNPDPFDPTIAIYSEGVAISPDGNKIYVANIVSGSVSIVNASTHSVITTITGLSPRAVATETPGPSTSLPTVTGLGTTIGPTTGGTTVVIMGTNFTAMSEVFFGTTAAASIVIDSTTQITATSPAVANAGPVNVFVQTENGLSSISSAAQFTYQLPPTPTVTSVTPNYGPAAGGTSVTISGTNLTGTTAVTFGGVNGTMITNVNATTVTAVSPTGTGTVHVQVTSPNGTSAPTVNDQFTYIPAPVITGLTIHEGPETGNTSLTINGTNLSNTTQVLFGTTPATSFMNVSATSVTAVSPAGTGTVDVRVQTAGGTSPVSVNDEFTYVPLPTVTSITPSKGPLSGGTSIIITGTNLSNTTQVLFGTTPATSFMNVSATSVTAVSQAGTGTVDVRIVTAGGTSPVSVNDQFTYVPLPTVTSITPSKGPLSGGTSITITGTNLSDTTQVLFGTTPATSFMNVSATSVTAVSPAGTGTVDVTVQTAGGTSLVSVNDEFTYVPLPTVTSITPLKGPLAGGTSITITGTDLSDTTQVLFGTTPATSFMNVSATSVTAVSPAGTAGPVDVRVTTPGGTSPISGGDVFAYVALPTVTSISPPSGPLTGGTSITITGTNLSNTTQVLFGTTPATSFMNMSATSVTAVSPAGTAGPVDVRVTTPGGTSPISGGDVFAYVALPTVTSISPPSGPLTGGTSITITGTNLSNATQVLFGTTPATSFMNMSATSVTAVSPAGTAGPVDVRVTTPGGTSPISGGDVFAYVALPTVTSISSPSGPLTGGTSITITGTNLSNTTQVLFGTTPAISFMNESETSVTAVSPAGTAGPVDVRVTTPGGTSPISPNDHFTYTPAANITNVQPGQATNLGGTTVVITGFNFINVQNVLFGTISATSFTVDSPTQITAVSPPKPPLTPGFNELVHIRVQTPAGLTPATPADEFTYQCIPAVTSLDPSSGQSFGGINVKIYGYNLNNGATVMFGPNRAQITGASPDNTYLSVDAPAGTGVVNISVTNNNGTSASSINSQFTYIQPTIETMAPNQGPESGGTVVDITGTNLWSQFSPTEVFFGATKGEVISATASKIVVRSPLGTPSTVDVKVKTAYGISIPSQLSRFTYTPLPPKAASLSGALSPSVQGQGVITQEFTWNIMPNYLNGGYYLPDNFTLVGKPNKPDILPTKPGYVANPLRIFATTGGGEVVLPGTSGKAIISIWVTFPLITKLRVIGLPPLPKGEFYTWTLYQNITYIGDKGAKYNYPFANDSLRPTKVSF